MARHALAGTRGLNIRLTVPITQPLKETVSLLTIRVGGEEFIDNKQVTERRVRERESERARERERERARERTRERARARASERERESDP
jgi:serine/threonine-protein kinase CLA4